MKIAYIMSRFPKVTETFILLEMVEVMRQGLELHIYPLLREQEKVRHPEVEALMSHVQFLPHGSWEIWRMNLAMLAARPLRYLATLAALISPWSIRPLNGILKSLFLFPKSVAIARLVQEQRIDCVHAHFATYPATAAWIITRLTGIPFTFTAHASDIHAHSHLLTTKVRDAMKTITISDYNRKFILERTGPRLAHKIAVIHCGVEVEQYGDDTFPKTRRSSFDKECCQVICVGSFTEYKGHIYLIDACQQLLEQGLNFCCHLVGDGPLRPQIEARIAAADLGQYLLLHGACPRNQVRDLLQTMDIAVLASVQTRRGDREGIPVALMEAMAAGLPVVASDLSGIPELIEHRETGLLVAPRDARQLAAALSELYHDPELRQRLGRQGQAKVRRDFDLTTCTGKLVSLWEREFIDAPSGRLKAEG